MNGVRDCTNAIRKIRAIGRHCIELRLKALDNKEELPLDIMSQILSIVRELCMYILTCIYYQMILYSW